MSNTPKQPNRDNSDIPVGNEPSDSDLENRLDSLASKLGKHEQIAEKIEENEQKANPAGIAQAMRLSSEFIAAIFVGAGIGYLVDTFAGSSPWGMIVFLFLGFGAGVLNVLRSAGLIAESNLHLKAGIEPKNDE